MYRQLRGALGFFALAAALLVAATAQAQAPSPEAALELNVKAAFMYKFLSYVDYPAGAFGDPAAPVLIGVAGSDEMAAELGRIVAGRTLNNRPILVRQFKDGDTIGAVQLLFVAGADCARAAHVLRQAPPGPVLAVTECGSGLPAGSVINFRIVEERVRFDVSLEAADKNNIKLSSRLLTVANHVSKGAP